MEEQTTAEALARVLTGLEEYTILDAFEDDGGLVVEVIATRPEAPCPGCGTFSGRVKSYRPMTVIDAASHGRRCRLRVRRRAFRCVTPGCVRRSFTESTDEVPLRARITTRARELMGRAGRDRSTTSVASEFGVSWPTAWRAIRAAARHSISAWGGTRRAPRRLGIDETRFWWRQPWLTGLVDLDTRVLIDVVAGRDAKSVTTWLDAIGDEQRARIEVVVTDPHAGYRLAVQNRLGDAVTVVDRFHVAMLANRAVTDVRRRRIQEQQNRRGRKVDPGWRARRDLTRRSERLTDRGWRRIIDAMRADTGSDALEGELAFTWAAKEDLTWIYDSSVDRAHAHRRLLWWYGFVAEHPVPELVRLATTISAWEDEFLAYFDTDRSTNGVTEGLNRIIKQVKRVGFGFRNTDNYRLRILYRCRPLPSTPPATTGPAAASSS